MAASNACRLATGVHHVNMRVARHVGRLLRIARLEGSALIHSRQASFALGYAIAFGLWRALATSLVTDPAHSPPWAMLALGGPPANATFIVVLEWISLPAAFIVFVGEPQTGRWFGWSRFVFVRSSNRFSWWVGQVMARITAACIYGFLVVGITWAAGSAGADARVGSVQGNWTWVVAGIVFMTVWYDTLFVAVSSVFRNATISVAAVIGAGMILIELASRGMVRAALLGPALGAILGSEVTHGQLWLLAVITVCVVFMANVVAYLRFTGEVV